MGIKEHLTEKSKTKYLSESPYTIALWITPKGQVLDCSRESHISFVLKNPKKFGLDNDDIKDCATIKDAETSKYPRIERITTYTDGIESKAWNRIMTKVLKTGFIRLRKVRSNKFSYIWFVSIYEYNKMTRKRLSDWAYNMGEKEQESEVMISVEKGEEPKKLTVKSLTGISEEHELLEMKTLEEVEDLCQ